MKPPRLLQRLSKTSNPHDTLELAFAFNTKVRIVHSGFIGSRTVTLHFWVKRVMFSFHQLWLWDAATLKMGTAMELDAFTRSSEISELGHLNTKKSPIVASYNSLRRKK